MKKLLSINGSNASGGLYTLAALATYVEPFCEVRILNVAKESIDNVLVDFKPDVVGATSYTMNYLDAVRVMRRVRDLVPEALRVIGGVHISCLPESLDPVFDVGVIGDGEETLLDLMRLTDGKDAFEVPGTCCQEGDGVKVRGRAMLTWKSYLCLSSIVTPQTQRTWGSRAS